MLTWIDDDLPLPAGATALGADSDAPGLVAAGGSLIALGVSNLLDVNA